MGNDTINTVMDAMRQATDGYARAMQVGLKFQNEALQFWGKTLGGEQGELDLAGGLTQGAEFYARTAERAGRMLEQQSQRTVEMLRKGLGLTQGATPAESLEKATGVWTSSIDAMRDSFDAVARFNTETLADFSETIRSGGNGHSTPAARTRRTGRGSGRANGK